MTTLRHYAISQTNSYHNKIKPVLPSLEFSKNLRREGGGGGCLSVCAGFNNFFSRPGTVWRQREWDGLPLFTYVIILYNAM